jgi:hypothetical protein
VIGDLAWPDVGHRIEGAGVVHRQSPRAVSRAVGKDKEPRAWSPPRSWPVERRVAHELGLTVPYVRSVLAKGVSERALRARIMGGAR